MLLRSLAVVVAVVLSSAASAQTKGKLIVHQLSGLCLDVIGTPGVNNGARLSINACERSGRYKDGSVSDQFWELTAQGFIRNTVSGRCVDVSGAPGVANGAAIILYDCELSGRNPNGSTTDQRWVVTADGLIQNQLSNKCIDVAGAPGASPNSRLQLWDCETSGRNAGNGSVTDQRWRY